MKDKIVSTDVQFSFQADTQVNLLMEVKNPEYITWMYLGTRSLYME